MTSPRPPTAPSSASSNGHRPTGGLPSGVWGPLPTANRPRGYVALAVMLIVGLATLGYWFATQTGARTPVLVAAHTIQAGQTISRADLTTVSVAGGVRAVAGDHLSEVVGQTAAVEILAHTPVQLAMVTTTSALAAGQALVGVAVAPGQIPSSGLVAGDLVEVLGLPAKSAAVSSVSSPVLATARVFDVRVNPAAEGGTLITVVVPTPAAYPITVASDAGLVALVEVGGGP